MSLFARFLKNDDGGSAAEYALLLGIVGAAIALAALALGDAVANSVTDSSNCIETDGASC